MQRSVLSFAAVAAVIVCASSVTRAGSVQPRVFAPGEVSSAAGVDCATFMPDGKTVFFHQQPWSIGMVMLSHETDWHWLTPEKVTLDGIVHPDSDDTLAFTPDDNIAFFDHGEGKHKTIMLTHRVDGHWSAPVVAGFSGRWYDQDPALAPDGSFLVFASDRPVSPGGQVLTRDVGGKTYHGGNLWKVSRKGDGWGKPVWLGPVVNASPFLVSPSIAANGTLYFIRHGDDGAMHIYSSHYRNGKYLPPERVRLGDPTASTHDPAIAPDGSFIVFGYGKTTAGPGRLCIAFREGGHWSKPIDLGDTVNGVGPWGSHVLPDGRTLTFTGDSGVYRLSLQPWLRGHGTHP